jgi:hypothetical protein
MLLICANLKCYLKHILLNYPHFVFSYLCYKSSFVEHYAVLSAVSCLPSEGIYCHLFVQGVVYPEEDNSVGDMSKFPTLLYKEL